MSMSGSHPPAFPAGLWDVDELAVPAADGVPLHVSCTGEGLEVVVLPGGPGCVHHLADEGFAPVGVRSWFPDPRGVGRSGGALMHGEGCGGS